MKIGLLTSGGDCPGLNAVIRGAVLHGIKTYGHEFVGFRDGWRGVVEGDIMDLPRTRVRGLAREGGTILGTSRTNPYDGPGGGPAAGAGATASVRQVTTNDTFMLTRHSVTLPLSSVTTLISLTQAPLMFLTDSAHFFRPCLTASSMLVLDAALSSMILATDMAGPLVSRRDAGPAALPVRR